LVLDLGKAISIAEEAIFMSEWKHDVSTLGGGQATPAQCWLASFRMMYRFHKQPVDSIEARLRAKGIDVGEALSTGLSDKSYAAAGEALGMKKMWSGELFKKPASFTDVGDTDGCEAFVEKLKDGPLWVSRFIDGGYHATVAIGYIDPGYFDDGYIIFNNPWRGPNNATEDRTMRANMYVKHITSAKGSVMAF
jgi:hypothetical protein